MTLRPYALVLPLVMACFPRQGDSGAPLVDTAGSGTGGSATDGGDATDSGGDGGLSDSGLSDGGAVDTADAFCEEGPTMTWANFGDGFLIENCNGCHAATSANRYGAPEYVTFDTVEQVWVWATIILAVATGDDPVMPPTGGVEDDDRLRLEYWLRCAESGT